VYREAWGFGFCFGEGEGEEAVAACEEGTEEGVEVEAEEAVTRGQVGTLMYMKVTECVDTYLDNNVAAVLVYTPSYNVAIPRLRTKRRRTRNAREIAVVVWGLQLEASCNEVEGICKGVGGCVADGTADGLDERREAA